MEAVKASTEVAVFSANRPPHNLEDICFDFDDAILFLTFEQQVPANFYFKHGVIQFNTPLRGTKTRKIKLGASLPLWFLEKNYSGFRLSAPLRPE
jgi:hypothetical protein